MIVGNEPNLNRFWLPQFNPDGTNASAPAYLALLARTYDALKAVDPTLRVWGGALAPRGVDRPDGTRPTSLARRVPPGDGRRVPGERPHAAGDGRPRVPPVPGQLVAEPRTSRTRARRRSGSPTTTSSSRCSGTAFDGTAQAGSSLPILYDEFGVESTIPDGQARASTPAPSPTTTKPVDETSRPRRTTSASGSRSASRTSAGSSSSTRTTRTALASWQSGVYYADGTPKASFWAVRDALDRTRGGSIARCDGLALDVGLTQRALPRAAGVHGRQARHAVPLHARLRLGAPRDAHDDRRRRGARCAATAARADDRRLADRPQARQRRPCG